LRGSRSGIDRGLILPLVMATIALGGCGALSGPLRSLSASEPPAAASSVAAIPEPSSAAGPLVVEASEGLVGPVDGSELAMSEVPAASHPASETGTASNGLVAVSLEETVASPRMPRAVDDDASAQAKDAAASDVEEDYDPWEPFNEKMFAFNRNLDRYVLKPVAQVYNMIIPPPFQLLIENGFDNIRSVPRFINSLLQGKWKGAGREAARFLINSTAGIGGLFDPAKNYWGVEKSREDFGQTLAVWGSGPGPYLILPLLPPLTVRDGIGYGVDALLDPLSYLLPFFWDRVGMKLGDTINDRALNIELYQGFEESVIDMYSAVRHAYMRRREQLIKE
jgi:phospholipid-binding lipoprotein MlaA